MEIADNTPSMEQQRTKLVFKYQNYKGITGIRTVRDPRLEFGLSDWHEEEQWFLVAFDVDKQAERWFALKDILTTFEQKP